MASYTSLQFPYFAPEEQLPAPLPTYEEIISSRDSVQGYWDNEELMLWKQVVRVKEHFVVKYGIAIDNLDSSVQLVEGENMLFVKNNTKIRVPIVYALYQRQHEGVKCNFIVMEYIAGDKLAGDEQAVKDLVVEDRLAMATQLRTYLDELRGIPSPGFYGVLGGRRTLFSRYNSPFPCSKQSVDVFFKYITLDTSYWDDSLNELFREKLESIRPKLSEEPIASVFTHGRLHPRNMIRESNGTICLIGWRSAEFRPVYHEYISAMPPYLSEYHCPCQRDWVEMVDIILDPHEERLNIAYTVREEWAKIAYSDIEELSEDEYL
jgi:hypothetical protein